MEVQEKGEGMVNPENLRYLAQRIESFGKGRVLLNRYKEAPEFDAESAKRQIVRAVALEDGDVWKKVVDEFSMTRSEVDKIWDAYGNIPEIDRGGLMYKDLAGMDSVGRVDVKRTDISIHFVFMDPQDARTLIELGRESDVLDYEIGKGWGLAFNKLAFSREGLEGRHVITAEVYEEDGRKKFQDVMNHEREHVEQRIYLSSGAWGRINWGIDQIETVAAGFAGVFPKSEDESASATVRKNTSTIASLLKSGWFDSVTSMEMMARVKAKTGEKYKPEVLVDELSDVKYTCLPELASAINTYRDVWAGEKIVEFEKLEAQKKAAGSNDEQETVFELLDKFSRQALQGDIQIEGEGRKIYKGLSELIEKRIKTGVDVWERLERVYGDREMVFGMLMPFSMRYWPAVERILNKYGTANVALETLE